VIVTSFAALYTRKGVDASARCEFEFTCNEIRINIKDRLEDSALILYSGAALFNASAAVPRQAWKTFTGNLRVAEQMPGIQGIGFAILIPAEQLDRHIKAIRAEGFPEYRVVPEGERETYSSIIYLEPFTDRNLRAFGYDMFSEPVRRAAMERARDGNTATLSGKVTLVQENGQDIQAGTLMYVPVYRHGMPIETVEQRREAIQGWVYSPYRMSDLMAGTIRNWNAREKYREVSFQIFDGGTVSPETLLFDSRGSGERKPGSKTGVPLSIPVEFGGNLWTLRFIHEGDGASGYVVVWAIFLGGTLINLLLSAFLLSLLGTRKRALRMAEELTVELRESEEKYRIIFDNEIYAICIFDLGTLELLDVNEAYTHVYGYSREELLSGMTIHDITAEHQASDAATVKATREGTTFIPLRYHRKKDGTVFPVEIVGGPYLWKGRKVMFALAHDITDRKKMEEALRDEQRRLEGIVEGTRAGTWEWNVQTGETVFNELWARMIGYTLGELAPIDISTWESLTHPDDLKKSGELLERHFAGETAYYDCECRMRHKGGQWVWVHDRGCVITRSSDGRPLMMLGTHIDITSRKNTEQELLHTFKVNRDLLAELQHRAKNSFTMISSMIHLTSGSRDSPELKNALHELDVRVRSVSELYSLLYSTGSFGQVNLGEYLERLAAPLVGLSENISLETDLEDMTVTAKTAAPIGLIITELITNAIKYAFPGGRHGTISIGLHSTPGGAVFDVTDDGIGLPEGFDISVGSGMGYALVRGLTDQIAGSFSVGGDAGGTRCRVAFSIGSEKEAK